MTRHTFVFVLIFVCLILLALVLSAQDTNAGCAAVYPNICPATITPSPTPCIPRGWCRGQAGWKGRMPPGQSKKLQ